MKALENRTLDSKIEMEIMDALDEIKSVNRRHETIDTEAVLKVAAARREGAAGGSSVSSILAPQPKFANPFIIGDSCFIPMLVW